MYSQINLVSFIISIFAGIMCGALLASAVKRPQPVIEFGISVVLAAMSPFIMSSGWLIAVGKSHLTGINISLLLIGVFGTMSMIFLYRLISGRKTVKQAG